MKMFVGRRTFRPCILFSLLVVMLAVMGMEAAAAGSDAANAIPPRSPRRRSFRSVPFMLVIPPSEASSWAS